MSPTGSFAFAHREGISSLPNALKLFPVLACPRRPLQDHAALRCLWKWQHTACTWVCSPQLESLFLYQWAGQLDVPTGSFAHRDAILLLPNILQAGELLLLTWLWGSAGCLLLGLSSAPPLEHHSAPQVRTWVCHKLLKPQNMRFAVYRKLAVL